MSTPPGGHGAPSPHTAPPLVGRDRELATLREHLAAALVGRGGLVLIGGEAGIGKTALAEALCAEARGRGALVLVGRCYDLAETPPYGPWVEALAAYPADGALPPLPAALTRHGRGAAVASQGELFDQAHDALVALAAGRPLVLLLDDLHWADPTSLDLLRHLARGLAGLPLLLLATYRADELSPRHALHPLLPHLVREARADRVELRPLGEASLRALVAARYPLLPADAARLVAYLRAHAEGNAFHTGELLRALAETGTLRRDVAAGWALGELAEIRVPPLLRQLVDQRVARLGEAAHRLLSVAAILGQAVPLGLWGAVSGAAEETLLDLLERAAEAHLLEPTPDGARFAHALVREALYEGTLPLRRRRMHLRAAEVLLARPDPDPGVVAYHLRLGGDPRAAAWLVAAGERALRVAARLSAADAFAQALGLLEAQGADPEARGWLLYRLTLLRRFVDHREGREALGRVAHLAALAGDQALAACATFAQGLYDCSLNDLRGGLAAMAAASVALDHLSQVERARLAAPDRLGAAPEEYAAANLALWLAHAGRYAEAYAQGATTDRAGVPGAVFPGTKYQGHAYAAASLGDAEAAARLFARAREAYGAAQVDYQVGMAIVAELNFVALPSAADRRAAWLPLVAEAEQAWARASGSQARVSPGLALLPFLHLDGRWREARALAEENYRLGTSWPFRYISLTVLGSLARDQGEHEAGGRLVGEALPAGLATAPGDAHFPSAVSMQRLAAALALEASDLPAARTWLDMHDRWLAFSGAVLGQAEGRLLWAAYHRAAGDPAAARRNAAAALAHASGPRQPLALLGAHRLLGELDTAAGRHADARGHLDAALNLAEACAAPYERALTLLALADLHLARSDRSRAAAALDEARALLAPLQARPALTRAAALAARLADDRPAVLTARETEVLRLIVARASNREVAAHLGISERTVGRHIENLYRKIDARNRAEATAWALRHHLA